MYNLRKAYDSVNRTKLKNKLWAALDDSGLSNLIRLVTIMDSQLNYSILNEILEPEVGEIQGDPWSGILFIFFINDILNRIEQEFPGEHIQAFLDDIIS